MIKFFKRIKYFNKSKPTENHAVCPNCMAPMMDMKFHYHAPNGALPIFQYSCNCTLEKIQSKIH